MLPFKSGKELAFWSQEALDKFIDFHPHVKPLLDKSLGVLVFPSVVKAGFGIGGEYGEGCLFEGTAKEKKKIEFYNLLSVSYGFQVGAQVRTVIMLFMEEHALEHFRSISGWKIGVDASVAVVAIDAGLGFDTNELTAPILAIVTDRKGLMYNLSLEGSKITRIHR